MPVKRQVIAVFANRDMGRQTRTGAATFDGARRRWDPGKGFTAGAGHAGAEDPAYHKATRDILRFLGDILADILADLAQGTTARAAILTRRQYLVLTIQMIGQRGAVGVRLARGLFEAASSSSSLSPEDCSACRASAAASISSSSCRSRAS